MDAPPPLLSDYSVPIETLTFPTAQLAYLAEGAANVVYAITRPLNGNNRIPSLLRLRKALPTTLPVPLAHQLHTTYICPLFKAEQLVEQQPVCLAPDVIPTLNEGLHVEEASGRRLAKRHGVYLEGKERFGLLVRDMRALKDGEVTVEFKPKWLAHSPTMPEGSTRCRNCALRAQRAMLRLKEGREANGGGSGEHESFCPLDLVVDDHSRRRKVVKAVMANSRVSERDWERVERRLMDWLGDRGQLLMRRLRQVQIAHDPVGVLRFDGKEEKKMGVRIAMTVRDCTVFVRIPVEEGKAIEARLGDLDVKHAGKFASWKDVERKLIDDRWYHGRELPKGSKVVECALSTRK